MQTEENITTPDASNELCSICMTERGDPRGLVTTPCKHTFHIMCLSRWVSTPDVDTCPMCRGSLGYITRPSQPIDQDDFDDSDGYSEYDDSDSSTNDDAPEPLTYSADKNRGVRPYYTRWTTATGLKIRCFGCRRWIKAVEAHVCGRCKTARYCTNKCRESHWHSHHKKVECSHLLELRQVKQSAGLSTHLEV